MLNSISSKITSRVGSISSTIGKKVNGSQTAQRVLKYVDPKGFNNTFGTLVVLMTGAVVVPRVLTAAKRNPNDKEATNDEIKEILFRDVQTCAIILFALKILNSIIASIYGKASGLPMTNKPFQQVFDTNAKGVQGLKDKALEFINSPVEKMKKTGKNFLDLIHPTGGVKSLVDSEFVSKYSGMNSFSEVEKMFSQIDAQGGNSEKVFKDSVLKNLLKTAQEKLKQEKINKNFGIGSDKNIAALESKISSLEALMSKENSTDCFKNNGEAIDDSIKDMLACYFKDPENMLVTKGRRVSSALRTMALAIEALYLGFGLPALNQKRLEKKYLSKNPPAKELNEIANEKNNNRSILYGAKIDAREAKIFKNFI